MTNATNPIAANRFVPDPDPLFFRIFCGRVVKRDPITGIEYLVPFAPAPAQDSECELETAATWSVVPSDRGRSGPRRRFRLRS